MVKTKKILSGLLLAFLCVTFIAVTPVKADEDEETYAPLLIVDSYKVSDDIITPGEQFDLVIEVENTDKKMAAYGVLVNISFPDGLNTVYPTLPQAYLKSIEPGAKEKVTFKMKASPSYSRSTAVFSINILSDRTYSTYIYAPVKTDTSSFKIVSKSIPTEAYVGEKISAAISFKSLIDERLSNVTFQVFVDESEEAIYTANIGNISAEASKTQNVIFKINEKGEHFVRAVLSYSMNGEATTSTELISGTLTVNEAPTTTETQIQEVSEFSLSGKEKMTIFGCIGAAFALFIGIVVIAKKYN